ncbi:MAG: GGDEF domain-containing protein [Nitrospiraceae bacterium]|nr:MAG: GGDEF domain-containing protein [Nitrospiraceae bacterium]
MNIRNIFNMKSSNSPEYSDHFNLQKYFTLYSIGFFVLLTSLLGLVFITHEKKILVNSAVSAAKEFALQLNYHVQEKGIVPNIMSIGNSNIERSEDYEKLDKIISEYISEFPDIVKIKIFDRTGRTVYSTESEIIGSVNTHDQLKTALSGQIASVLTKRMKPMTTDNNENGKMYEVDILEIYLPIYEGHKGMKLQETVIGAFEVYKDVSEVFNEAKMGGYTISLLFILSMSILFLIWQMIIRKADRIIKQKNSEINKYNLELEEAQQKITESIDEVIKHESFHVRYINKDLIMCWELKKCTKTDCPSYESKDLRCWQVAGTFCGGKAQGIFAQKYGDCRHCEVFKHAFGNRINTIGESFNNMMALLQSKHFELQEANQKLNVLIDIDPLTQIANRRSFQHRIENTHLLTLRYNHPYSIIICDIDNFKLYNDTYGHQQGDYVLISVANTMKSSIRRTDEIFRWGGEEFIVILPEQNHTDALKVAENLRLAVHNLGIKHQKSDLQIVTISCGVASFYPWKTKDIGWEYVVKQADDALYKAKLGKKNCVYSASTV